MKIAIMVEGDTERAFKPYLLKFMATRLAGRMPKLVFSVHRGRIPTGPKLKRTVELHLADGNDAVIALTDVYTGTREFIDAADAKNKMVRWVGSNDQFHPHVAQFD